MAKRDSRQLTPSVLDRLLDDAPETSSDPPVSASESFDRLVRAVRRDLEHLLNTRRVPIQIPDELPELEHSLVGYGIPDITSARLSSQQAREEFLAAVEQAIRRFEPRFTSVQVHWTGDAERLDRTLTFRVDAMLRMEPAPEKVVFDSELSPATGAVIVRSPLA